jgi:hypothetical protein
MMPSPHGCECHRHRVTSARSGRGPSRRHGGVGASASSGSSGACRSSARMLGSRPTHESRWLRGGRGGRLLSVRSDSDGGNASETTSLIIAYSDWIQRSTATQARPIRRTTNDRSAAEAATFHRQRGACGLEEAGAYGWVECRRALVSPDTIRGHGEIAQLVEHAAENCGVLGSNPSLAIHPSKVNGDRRLRGLCVSRS